MKQEIKKKPANFLVFMFQDICDIDEKTYWLQNVEKFTCQV